jgi:hypothetical protein
VEALAQDWEFQKRFAGVERAKVGLRVDPHGNHASAANREYLDKSALLHNPGTFIWQRSMVGIRNWVASGNQRPVPPAAPASICKYLSLPLFVYCTPHVLSQGPGIDGDDARPPPFRHFIPGEVLDRAEMLLCCVVLFLFADKPNASQV